MAEKIDLQNLPIKSAPGAKDRMVMVDTETHEMSLSLPGEGSGGGSTPSITVDGELNEQSTNAVQNKPVAEKLAQLEGKSQKTIISFDYGGIAAPSGKIVFSKQRLHSEPIYPWNQKFSKVLEWNIIENGNVLPDTKAYSLYKFKDGVCTEEYTKANNNKIEVQNDGTFDYLRVVFSSPEESEFSDNDKKNLALSVDNNPRISTLEKDVYGTTYNLEYGGLTLDGNPANNKIRYRSVFIKAKQGVNRFKIVNYEKIGANDCRLYSSLYTYKEGVFIKKISTSIDQNLIFTNDGSFDSFRLAGKSNKGDSIEIPLDIISNVRIVSSENQGLKEDVEDLKKVPTNPYFRKKLVSLGDSITYGFAPRNTDYYRSQIDSYAKITARNLNMEFENFGKSGSTVSDEGNGERDPMCNRWNLLPDDADIVTFMGGTNDVRSGIRLGTMADRTKNTFYGALHIVMSGLYDKYFIKQGAEVGKTKKIVVCTPIKLLATNASISGANGTLNKWNKGSEGTEEPTWINAIKEVAAYYSFPVLDFYNMSFVNPHLNCTLKARKSGEPGYEAGYDEGFYNIYMPDGTHPSRECAEFMADALTGFLKSLK